MRNYLNQLEQSTRMITSFVRKMTYISNPRPGFKMPSCLQPMWLFWYIFCPNFFQIKVIDFQPSDILLASFYILCHSVHHNTILSILHIRYHNTVDVFSFLFREERGSFHSNMSISELYLIVEFAFWLSDITH